MCRNKEVVCNCAVSVLHVQYMYSTCTFTLCMSLCIHVMKEFGIQQVDQGSVSQRS